MDVQWARSCLLLVLYSLIMRFHQVQLPQYEDVTIIILDQSLSRMVGMSLIRRIACSQSLEIIFYGFGGNLFVFGLLSDLSNGDSNFPCIEDWFRCVLTVFVAMDLVPIISFALFGVVDGKVSTKPTFNSEDRSTSRGI